MSFNNYNPDRDDYLRWRSDWEKREEWLDGTHTNVLHYSNTNTYIWYQNNGKKHRDDDKPAVISTDYMEWYQDGFLNRDGDKPAIIHKLGERGWYQNGSRHRLYDRPAIITAEGYKEWWKNGNRYFPETFMAYLDKPRFFSLFITEIKTIIELDTSFTKRNLKLLLPPKIQKKICSIDPSIVAIIPKDLLLPELEKELSAYIQLDDLGI